MSPFSHTEPRERTIELSLFLFSCDFNEVKIIHSKMTFVASVESVLLYGFKAWSTVQLGRNLDGVYARVLRMVLNVSWGDRFKNVDL